MPQPSSAQVHTTDELLPATSIANPTNANSPVAKRVEKRGDSYCVVAESGKSMGCYPTKDEATKRLRQVEFFKNFDAAHAALHAAYDDGNFTVPLAKSTRKDPRLVAEAHASLVELAKANGITHPVDPDSRLDLVHFAPDATTDPRLAPTTGELLHKAAVLTAEEDRYTLAPLYIPNTLDAHKEWADPGDLQKAQWALATSGDTNVYLQHRPDIVAGTRVDLVSWPHPVRTGLVLPTDHGPVSKSVTLPANTIYQGTIWEEWSWPLVKSGKLRGLSMGGFAKRQPGEVPTSEAAFDVDTDQAAQMAKSWFRISGETPGQPPRTTTLADGVKAWFAKHGRLNR